MRAVVGAVKIGDLVAQPAKLEDLVDPGQDVVVGDELPERPRHEELELISVLAPQHRRPSTEAVRLSESRLAAPAKPQQGLFNSPRVHFQRNALAHAGKSSRRVVSAFIATAFAQPDHAAARAQWRLVADQMRPKLPKLAALMDGAEEDVLAYMTFPAQHRAKLHSTNPVERLNAEIKRRTDVVGIFPNEASITRLVGAILMEQTEEWAVQRSRYMTLETLAPIGDDAPVSLPAAQTD